MDQRIGRARGNRGFGEAGQDQLQLAGIGDDVADGEDAGLAGRGGRGIDGDLVVLEEQDRTLWNRPQIDEALTLVAEALAGAPGPFALEAAIAAEHCKAARAEDTNWSQIVELSTKALPSEAVQAFLEWREFLQQRGIELTGEQQTKTKAALEFFTRPAA